MSGDSGSESLLNAAIAGVAGFGMQSFTQPVKVATIKAADNRAKYTFKDINHQRAIASDIERLDAKLERLSKRFNRLGEARKRVLVDNLANAGILDHFGGDSVSALDADAYKVHMKAQISGLRKQLTNPDKFNIAQKLIDTSAFSSRITTSVFSQPGKYIPQVYGQAIDNNIVEALSQRFMSHHNLSEQDAVRTAKSLGQFLGQGDFKNVFMTDIGIKFGQGRNERHLPIPFQERNGGALYLKSGGKTSTQIVPRFNPFGDLYSKGQSFTLGQKSYGQVSLDMLRTGYLPTEMLGFNNALGKMSNVTDFDMAMDEMNKMRHYIAGNYDVDVNGSSAIARQVSNTIKLNKTLSFNRDGLLEMRNMMPNEMADILSKISNDSPEINILGGIAKQEVMGIQASAKDVNPLGTPFFEASRSELSWARDTFSVQNNGSKPKWLDSFGGEGVSDFKRESTFATKRIVQKTEQEFIANMLGSGFTFGDGQGLAFGGNKAALTSATDISIKIPLNADGSVTGINDIFGNIENPSKIQAIKSGEVIATTADGPITLGKQFSHAKIKGYKIVDDTMILQAAAFADPSRSGYQKIFSSDSKLGLQILTGEAEDKLNVLMQAMATGRASVKDGSSIIFDGQEMSAHDFSLKAKLLKDDFGKYGATIFSDADNAGMDTIMDYVNRGNFDLARKEVVETITSRSKAGQSLYMTMMNRLDDGSRAQVHSAINSIIGAPEDVAQESMLQIEDFVNQTFQQKEDFQNIDVAYRVGQLQAITGAGGDQRGGMSRLHYKSLMESKFGADRNMANSIINNLTETNSGAIYETDMLRSQLHAGQISSENADAIRGIFESDAQERLFKVEQAFGKDVADSVKQNNMLINYNLSKDYDGLKSVAIPMLDSQLSGLNEFGVDIPTMKSLDKSRLALILADIDAKMETNAELRKFKFAEAEKAAQQYVNLQRNRFAGDGVAKQALSRKNRNGGIKTARIGGGRFAEKVAELQAAEGHDSFAGISGSQLREYAKQVEESSGGKYRLTTEEPGFGRVLLEDVNQGNKTPYNIHVAREPAQGIGSFGAFELIVDKQFDRVGNAANLYFTENNPLSRTASMDVDGDTLSMSHTATLTPEQRGYYVDAMRQNRALLDTDEIQGVGKGLGKGAKNKDRKLGLDYAQQEEYIRESNIESRKARLHKIAAPDVTKINFAMNDALARFGQDVDPKVSSMANILGYQLTETMLKTKHMQNEQFLQMQRGSVEGLENAMSEVNRTSGRDPYAVSRLKDVITESLLPDRAKMKGQEAVFDSAVDLMAQSYGKAALHQTMAEVGQIREIARQKNISELADSVLKYTTSQGSGGASSGLTLDTSIKASLNDAPVETAKNLFNSVSEIVMENIRKNKGIVALAQAGLVGSALMHRQKPVMIEEPKAAVQQQADYGEQSLPQSSKAPTETLQPIQSKNAYVRKFSDKEVQVQASKSGDIRKPFDQAYNGQSLGDANIIIRNG